MSISPTPEILGTLHQLRSATRHACRARIDGNICDALAYESTVNALHRRLVQAGFGDEAEMVEQAEQEAVL
jgi:hypothetical protein